MNKVKHSSKNITPFGGLNFIFLALRQAKLSRFIDDKLGSRNYRAKYSYSDVVYSLLANSISNGSHVSDLESIKGLYSEQIFTQIPSPDTVEYVCQELKSPTIEEVTDKGVVHQFNFCTLKNEALIALCVKTGQLKCDEKYTLDFDNVVIETEKQDAEKSYKGTRGYQPNFAFIGRLPVHIENHNGNTPAKYKQRDTLDRCFNNLDVNGIRIEKFRADSASYQKEVIDLLEKRVDKFYIRNVGSADFDYQCGQISKWEKVEINFQVKEVATLMYAPFGGTKKYRIVVTRTPNKDKQLNIFSKTHYNYYGIITNDYNKSSQELIQFYNQRGDSENSNKFLLRDFNLSRLPFMDLDTNTVFMYLMALCEILFEWTKIVLVKNNTPKITVKMRVKAVCFNYISVASRFIRHSKERIIEVYSNRTYQILQI